MSERIAFKTPSFGVCALGGGVASPLPVLRSKQKHGDQQAIGKLSGICIFHLLLFAELSAGKKVIDVPNQDNLPMKCELLILISHLPCAERLSLFLPASFLEFFS